MTRLALVLIALISLSGCASTGGFVEMLQVGMEEAGVTFEASASVGTEASIKNRRSDQIVILPETGLEIRIP